MTLSNCQLIYIIIEMAYFYMGLASLQMSHDPAAWETEGPLTRLQHMGTTGNNPKDPAAMWPSHCLPIVPLLP